MTTPIKKLTKVRLYLLFLLSILGVVLFASKTYAEGIPFQPTISFNFAVSRQQCNSSSCWWVYGSEYVGNAVLDSYDSTEGVGTYHFELGTSWQSWCQGYSCAIDIRYVNINTRYLVNGSYVSPDFSQGNIIHIQYIAPNQFYYGDGSDINANYTGQGYNWSVAGGDIALGGMSSSPYLCLAQGADICTTHYYESITPSNTSFTVSMDFDRTDVQDTLFTLYTIGMWPFNTNQDSFSITSGNSYIHSIPWRGSSTNLTFKVKVWTDGTFSSEAEGTDIEESIYQQQEIINNNMNDAQSAASLLNFSGFNVPWIFSAWFSLFINNDCVNIPILAGMLHTNNTQVCSPWAGTNIRTILTPIFGALSSMLAFAFVIRWLSNSNDIGKDDLGDIWYGK